MKQEADILELNYRLKAAESNIESHRALFSEIQKEMVRTDEGLKGVREQAKAHSKTTSEAIADIKKQMGLDRISMETMIAASTRELQQGLDKVISALGIDEDVHAASQLRDNLKVLSGMIMARKEDITAIKRGMIGLIVIALGTIIVLGLKAYFAG